MKMNSFLKKAAALALLLPTLSFAYVVGGSNLPLREYPKFDEYPPWEPMHRDRRSFDEYRSEVERYVQNAQEYVDNARNDQKRAQEAAEEAIKKANRAIDDFNNWADGY